MKTCHGLFLTSAALILLIALLPGCATTMPTQEEMQKSLLTTAELYWKLRMQENYEAIYKMEDSEDLPPFAQYVGKVRAMRRLYIVSHEVTKAVAEGDKGTVDLDFQLMLPQVSKPVRQPLREQWVFKKGKWLHKLPK